MYTQTGSYVQISENLTCIVTNIHRIFICMLSLPHFCGLWKCLCYCFVSMDIHYVSLKPVRHLSVLARRGPVVVPLVCLPANCTWGYSAWALSKRMWWKVLESSQFSFLVYFLLQPWQSILISLTLPQYELVQYCNKTCILCESNNIPLLKLNRRWIIFCLTLTRWIAHTPSHMHVCMWMMQRMSEILHT